MSFLRTSFRLGLREARGSWKKLLVFASAIALGIAAMCFARALNITLAKSVALESRQLLGADVMLSSREPIAASIIETLRSKVVALTLETRFRSMVRTTTGAFHITQVRGFEGSFPFYGELITQPPDAWQRAQSSETPAVIIDEVLATKLQLSPGDSLEVGGFSAQVSGIALAIPGDTSPMYAFAPRIFVADKHIPKNQLLSRGAIADYFLYIKLADEISDQQFVEEISPLLAQSRLESTTVAERQELLGEISKNLSSFFGLIGLITLFLGGLGAVSTLSFYLRQKRSTVATLKCLGASQRCIEATFSAQILMAAAVASLVGAVSGVLIGYYAPLWFSKWLPFQVTPTFAWNELLVGILVGTFSLALVLFPSLASLARATPLEVLRPSETPLSSNSFWQSFWQYFRKGAPLLLTVFLLGVLSSDKILFGLLAASGVVLTLGLLFFFTIVLRRGIRRFRTPQLPLHTRYALSSLDRPGNQTSLLMVSFGLSAMLLSVVLVCHHALRSQTEIARSGVTSTAFMVDIQPDQRPLIRDTLSELQIPLKQESEILLMRLNKIGDRLVSDLSKDPEKPISKRSLNREYWSTSRADLLESESVVEGVWIARVAEGSDIVPVSIERRFMQRLGLSLGDMLEFDMAGIPIQSQITSVREVRWERMERNSFLVFPEGSLKQPPHFMVMGVLTSSAQQTAQLMAALSKSAPNVSVFDVRSAVATIDGILEYLLKVLSALSILVFLAAVITMFGAVSLGRSERRLEQALLRTVGASRRFVEQTLTYEYAILGILASVLGIGCSFLVSFPIVVWGFRIPFSAPVMPLIALTLVLPCIVVVLIRASRGKWWTISPAESLRNL